MNILLIALNAKYIHTNLALYNLKSYAKEYDSNITLVEYTINHYIEKMLQDIYMKKPDVIAFSCYIWNIHMIEELGSELHKVLPNTHIWMGGPEVTYDAYDKMCKYEFLTGIIIGEGEETFLDIIRHYLKGGELSKVKGIVYKKDDKIEITKPREPIDMNKIPFAYYNFGELKNKILYYETSRGCPFSCSYCLSSIDKKVRFKKIELVKRELDIFLSNNVSQVKFVDRTFNCNKEHTYAIWEYIRDNDNNITNFHFEISADLLNEKELELLKTLRPGLIQLEIGVQSVNQKTLDTICRTMDFRRLSQTVKRINEYQNIHQHLDLIAGLPYEDYESFKESFNRVYELRPGQLQLGFLKVLKGSMMHQCKEEYGLVHKERATYEVLYTKWISYEEIICLKSVENVLEIYYNSGQFVYSIGYLEHFFNTPYDMYLYIAKYDEKFTKDGQSHSRMERYRMLLEFVKDICFDKNINIDKKIDVEAFKEILIYDLYLRENLKSRPDYAKDMSVHKDWVKEFYIREEKKPLYLEGYIGYNRKQMCHLTHIEHFTIDILETVQQGKTINKDFFILFDYSCRGTLYYEAKAIIL